MVTPAMTSTPKVTDPISSPAWRPLVRTGLILLVIAAIIYKAALGQIEMNTRYSAGDALQTVLQTNHDAIQRWAARRIEYQQTLSQSVQLTDMAQQLLADTANRPSQLDALRGLLLPALSRNEDSGFFLLDTDFNIIAAIQNLQLGQRHPLATLKPTQLEQVISGETRFIHPVMINQQPQQFLASPITDQQGNTIALLLFQINLGKDLTYITQLGRLGNSGETYAINVEGYMLSNSRFTPTLRKIGLLGKQQQTSIGLRVADPGLNLTQKNRELQSNEGLPLTAMAKSASQNINDTDIMGYRDYRGIWVLGSWMWDQELGIGLATEIDQAEALHDFYQTRIIIIVLMITVVLVSLLLTYKLMRAQKKNEKQMLAGRLQLETQVQQRTAELLSAQLKLEQVADTDGLTNIPNRRRFDQHLASEWLRAKRMKQPLSLIMIDVDYFKQYNDHYGHQRAMSVCSTLRNSYTKAIRPDGQVI
nr:diguanylate cyclase [Oceanicoccus sp. KOV_DT_Chl]